MQRVLAGIMIAIGLAGGAHAQGDVPVDVELVLAVDVSRSMTERELDIQRRGYAEAIASLEVSDAIAGGAYGRIALTYAEWAGAVSQGTIVPWILLGSRPRPAPSPGG